jgi:hypothetical protein
MAPMGLVLNAISTAELSLSQRISLISIDFILGFWWIRIPLMPKPNLLFDTRGLQVPEVVASASTLARSPFHFSYRRLPFTQSYSMPKHDAGSQASGAKCPRFQTSTGSAELFS